MRVSGRMIKSKLSQYVHVIVHMIVHVAMGTRAVVGESSGSPPVLNAITVGMSTKIDLHIGISSILKRTRRTWRACSPSLCPSGS